MWEEDASSVMITVAMTVSVADADATDCGAIIAVAALQPSNHCRYYTVQICLQETRFLYIKFVIFLYD